VCNLQKNAVILLFGSAQYKVKVGLPKRTLFLRQRGRDYVREENFYQKFYEQYYLYKKWRKEFGTGVENERKETKSK